MDAPIEEIEFLARSKNRVEVLRLVATEPHTRASLARTTGASQATLGRILEDFTDRSWVRRDPEGYVATATGELVADAVGDLLSVLETESRLRDVVGYLPEAELDFDLRALADATVAVPTPTHPSAPLQRVIDAMERAGTLRAFSHALNEQSLSTALAQVQSGDLVFKTVLSESAIEALAAENALWSRLRDLAAEDGAEIRVRRDDISLAVTVADETVSILVRDEHGVLRASLHTDADAVRAWADDRFERYWEAAAPFDPAAFER